LTVINPAEHDTAATRIRARCAAAVVVNKRPDAAGRAL
jgi:hypothetical protein